MAKLVIKKNIAEEIKKKLESYKYIKNEKNTCESGDFVEKTQNLALTEENEQKLSKLQGSECVEKSHLYSDKYWVAGKGKKGGYWEYVYNKNNRIDKTLKKTNEKPLTIVYDKTQDNFTQSLQILSQAFDYIDTWVDDWSDPKNASKSICKELRGKKICFNDISYEHIAISGSHSKASKKNGKNLREPKNLLNHVPYLPIAKKSLEDEGLWTQARYEPLIKRKLDKTNGKVIKGYVYQTLSVELPKGSVHKYAQTTVSKIKYVDNSYSDTVYISVVGKDSIKTGEKTVKKSLANELDFITKGKTTSIRASSYDPGSTRQAFTNLIIPQLNNLSSKNVTKSLTYSGHKLQGRTKLYGMDISIENKKGTYRSGVDSDGHKWKTLMHYDYGYIRGTVGTDSDHVDCYIGPDKNAKKVYVIHQNNPVTHKYDEDKCMLCFENAEAAKKAYMKQYDRPGFFGSMETLTVEQFKSFVFSKQGSRIHKSFDICITDITENNKQKKYEQLEKALNAIYENKPFAIKHIQSDNKSTRYDNLYLRFTNFDKEKIEKALHKVSLSLDTNMKTVQGEKFLYKAEEELTDKLFRELSQKTLAIYNFVISYFDLPDIRIVSKSKLKWKGKVIYNPENGKPISTKEWQHFITELEKFLNRNYSGIGEKIVLSGEALGAILERLSKTNSLSAIKKMHLSELKIKRKDVDWISESVKNIKDVFGESITRERAARIQVAIDSAAQRVTRVKDDMRNNIQQIIIDGVRDKSSKSVVAQNLFDKCASLNRDMQRIADTELQIATNTAYIKEEVYNTKPEEKVYFERYEVLDDNTCKKCQKLKGAIALWSDVPLPNERIKDPYAKYAIWEGKLDGDAPIATVHPWCRGSWVRVFPELL